MTVSVSLTLTGTDEEPRWAAAVCPDTGLVSQHCCQEGHFTPEAAAAHGGELASAWLGKQARRLVPPACGALAIQKFAA